MGPNMALNIPAHVGCSAFGDTTRGTHGEAGPAAQLDVQ